MKFKLLFWVIALFLPVSTALAANSTIWNVTTQTTDYTEASTTNGWGTMDTFFYNVSKKFLESGATQIALNFSGGTTAASNSQCMICKMESGFGTCVAGTMANFTWEGNTNVKTATTKRYNVSDALTYTINSNQDYEIRCASEAGSGQGIWSGGAADLVNSCGNTGGRSVADLVIEDVGCGGSISTSISEIASLISITEEIIDTTPPIGNGTINNTSPRINDFVNTSLNVSDETALQFANLTINFTSGKIKINYTLSGTDAQISNNTQITDTRGNVLNFSWRFTDTSGNMGQNDTLITVADTLGSIFIGINNTSPKINEVINVSGNATDVDGDFSQGVISYNISGNPQRNFSFDISGTKGNFSRAITINLTRGNVINFTTFYNDTVGTTKQNSTLITILNTAPNSTNFVNATGRRFNDNATFNVTPSLDADSDTIFYLFYLNNTDNSGFILLSNTTDLNVTTNITSDGIYNLTVNVTDLEEIVGMNSIRFEMDTDTPILDSFNFTNNTFTSQNLTVTISVKDNSLVYNNSIRVWKGDKDYHANHSTTRVGQYINLTNLLLNFTEDGNYTIELNFSDAVSESPSIEEDYKKGKKGENELIFNDTKHDSTLSMKIYFVEKLDKMTDTPATLKSYSEFNGKGTHLNFGTNFTVVKPETKIIFNLTLDKGGFDVISDSGIKGHIINYPRGIDFDGILLVNGIERNYDAIVTQTDSKNVQVKISTNPVLAGNDIVEFKSESIFGLNVVELVYNYVKDATPPLFHNFSISGFNNDSFANVNYFNITVNGTDLYTDKAQLFVNEVINGSGSYNNETLNLTNIFLPDGNHTLKIRLNDTAGNEINSTFFYNLAVDTTLPTFTEAVNRTTANSTNILDNTDVNLSVFGVGDIYLKDGNISHNASGGTWINHSAFTKGNSTYHLIISQNNLTAGQVVGWKFYAYDLAGNELDPVFTFKVGDSSVVIADSTGGGGSSSGSSFNLNQLECNQRAKQQSRCLTYNPNSKSCEIGCQSGFSCNEDFVCQGAFLQPDYIPLANLLVPNLQEEQCFKQGYTFFQDSCYNCNGKLANLKGTIVCLQCKEGYRLDDNNVCIQTLVQRTQNKLNFIDNLARKISPNNPFLGFLIIIGISGIIIYAYSNRAVLRTKIRRS